MTAEVIRFPKRQEPNISARAADEHCTLALVQRDALIESDLLGKEYVYFYCVHSGIDGMAAFLKQSFPRLTNEQIAERLKVAVTFYCNDTLGVRE